MQVLLLGVLGLAGLVAHHLWQMREPVGTVPNWTLERAKLEAEATARYLGASHEHAKLVPGALTTREQERARDAAIVAEREARAAGPASEPGDVLKFEKRKVS